MKTKIAIITSLLIITVSNAQTKLSWEKNHPERAEWTKVVVETITPLFDTHFANCNDITYFRKDYNNINKQQKIMVWAELISAMAYYESGWKVNSYMTETTMGTDPVTQKQVKSEGLLQLSYQDCNSYAISPCPFNWEIDKNLKDDDVNKTIFKPENNLSFGVKILAKQIKNKKKIAPSKKEKGSYWAVLIKDGKYTKVKEIAKMINNFKI